MITLSEMILVDYVISRGGLHVAGKGRSHSKSAFQQHIGLAQDPYFRYHKNENPIYLAGIKSKKERKKKRDASLLLAIVL